MLAGTERLLPDSLACPQLTDFVTVVEAVESTVTLGQSLYKHFKREGAHPVVGNTSEPYISVPGYRQWCP
jgi:hypothetical protein